MSSRWANDDPETEAIIAQQKREKELKKRAKAEKQRLEDANKAQARDAKATAELGPPTKRRRLSNDPDARPDDAELVKIQKEQQKQSTILRFPVGEWGPCRHVDNFERLNHIEEGSYGWVSRAKDISTGEIVALKKLKLENSPDGFPVTGLREIQTLLEARHQNVVYLREVVMGNKMDDVFLVMDFHEHDLKALLDEMREPFLPSEIKTVLLQVVGGLEFLHSQWIMHRDLKTSNLLMNNRGELKIADFGMARYFGDPPPKLTQLVVTLWYRAPELLLGADKYGTEIDMWSIGCIFGELLTKEPLLQGKNEVDQVSKIFALTGPPNSVTWPGFRSLPNAKSLRLPSTSAPSSAGNPPLLPRSRFPYLTNAGLSLMSSLLALNPTSRPTARQCLDHKYFKEDPRPKPREMFPTFPSKAGMEKRRRHHTPEAPKRGQEAPELDFAGVFGGAPGGDTGEAWYGGNETGNAIGDVVFGVVNQSGKLSLSFPHHNEDNPAFLNFRSERGSTKYGEGVYIGYRFYEKCKKEVAFPFGHGLSYTTSKLSSISLQKTDEEFLVTVNVQNTGTLMSPSINRPPKELKGFEKVFLCAQQTETVTVKIPTKYATSFWDEHRNAWVQEIGRYRVQVGTCSAENPLSADFEVEQTAWRNGLS